MGVCSLIHWGRLGKFRGCSSLRPITPGRLAVRVPLLDLTAQYQSTKDAVLPALMSVIERQQFIMGPEVPALETDIARLCHTRHAIGCASGTRFRSSHPSV